MIFQARTLEWVAISFSRVSSQPRDWIHISCVSRIGSGFFSTGLPGKPYYLLGFSKPQNVGVAIMIFLDYILFFSTDRNLATDISPNPTIFLPTIAEMNHSKTGTYLCLLEKFFPDVIEVYWKEKDGNRALPSQKGNTMKTTDTYMKFSWLTVAENSMDKEHICVVKHERNIGGTNQEILFPSINEGMWIKVNITSRTLFFK